MKCQQMLLLFSAIVACVMSCEVPCTREMEPVCGTDGESFVAFSNECMMKNQKCKDGKTWTKSDIRSCGLYDSRVEEAADEACPKQCLMMIVFPVCGYNGESYKIFENPCEMKKENCLLPKNQIYNSAPLSTCRQAIASNQSRSADLNCPLICPANYEPTCGSDGKNYKLFGNKCTMGVYNCIRSESWQLVSLELCPQES
ncbi:unnamed protein product [Hermetia illucens]|uniref:Kazal-like domain-containing protein n=1 Tax=Hermetia illucens TaxID=343691 RepID=A0A7R8UR86_HERIL|nr:unnamed protein product [Hermetia illucens]